MGMGGISIWQLLIVLVIVLLLFGTKKLKNIGSDLGGAVKGFRSAMSGDKDAPDEEPQQIENAADATPDATPDVSRADRAQKPDPTVAKPVDKTKV
jgi:sec-independent protein translocase protein TatA